MGVVFGATRAKAAWPWLALALVIVASTWMRSTTFDMPMERDEGEYAYVSQRLLLGESPYLDTGNHKFPGAYFAYALWLALFGQTPSGIRLGLALLVALSQLCTFVWVRRLFVGSATPQRANENALVAAAAFGLMSMSSSWLGVAGHITHGVAFGISLAACGLTSLSKRTGRAAAVAGLGVGLAVLFRQTSVVVLVMALLWWWTQRTDQRRHVLTLLAGAAVPLCIAAFYLWHHGALHAALKWTLLRAAHYGLSSNLYDGARSLLGCFSEQTAATWAFALVAGVGLVASLVARRLGLSLLGALFLALVPGYFFRQHYFLQLVPALALGAAGAWSLQRAWLKGLLVAAALVLAWVDIVPLLLRSPTQQARLLYTGNPFPDAEVLGQWIGANTSPSAEIAMAGSEPQLAFYAKRKLAFPVLYIYPVVDVENPGAPQLQRDVLNAFLERKPQILVHVGAPASWPDRADMQGPLMTHLREAADNYHVVAASKLVVDERLSFYDRFGAEFLTTPEQLTHASLDDAWVLVLERND